MSQDSAEAGHVQIWFQYKGDRASALQRTPRKEQTDEKVPLLETLAIEDLRILDLTLSGVSYSTVVNWGTGQLRLINKSPIPLTQVRQLQVAVGRVNARENEKSARSIARIQCKIDNGTRQALETQLGKYNNDSICTGVSRSGAPILSRMETRAKAAALTRTAGLQASSAAVADLPPRPSHALKAGVGMSQMVYPAQRPPSAAPQTAYTLVRPRVDASVQTTDYFESQIAVLRAHLTRDVERSKNLETTLLSERQEHQDVRSALEAERVQREAAETELRAAEAALTESRAHCENLEKAIDLERVRCETVDSACVDERRRREQAEAAVEAERRWRQQAEAMLEEVRRERAAPFVVPAIMDAFVKLVQLSDAVANAPEDGGN